MTNKLQALNPNLEKPFSVSFDPAEAYCAEFGCSSVD